MGGKNHSFYMTILTVYRYITNFMKGPRWKWTWEIIHITLKTKIKVKQQHFYYCSTFHSHSMVFNNHKMGVKLPLASSWAQHLLINTTCEHLCHFDVTLWTEFHFQAWFRIKLAYIYSIFRGARVAQLIKAYHQYGVQKWVHSTHSHKW